MVGITEEKVSIDVVDSGPGFGQHQVSPQGHEPHSVEDRRGLALMDALSDLAIFDSMHSEGGSVHLTTRLQWMPGAPRAERPSPR